MLNCHGSVKLLQTFRDADSQFLRVSLHSQVSPQTEELRRRASGQTGSQTCLMCSGAGGPGLCSGSPGTGGLCRQPAGQSNHWPTCGFLRVWQSSRQRQVFRHDFLCCRGCLLTHCLCTDSQRPLSSPSFSLISPCLSVRPFCYPCINLPSRLFLMPSVTLDPLRTNIQDHTLVISTLLRMLLLPPCLRGKLAFFLGRPLE